MSGKITITIAGATDIHQIALAQRIKLMLEYLDIEAVVDSPDGHTTYDNWNTELLDMTGPVYIVNESAPIPARGKEFLDSLKQTSDMVENWPSWKKDLWPQQQKPAKAPAISKAQSILDEIRSRNRKKNHE